MLILQSQSPFTALTINDVKAHLNVITDSTDAYLQTLLDAAVIYCERETGLDLRTTDWSLVHGQFPIWANYNWMDRYGNYVYTWPLVGEFAIGRMTQKWQAVNLIRGPVQSITSITYYDTNNVLQTMSSSDYAFHAPSFFPALVEPTTFWPVSFPRPDAVVFTFVSGFSTVPASILHAIKMLCGLWFAQREDISYGPNTASGAVGEAVSCLLGQFKVPIVG